MSSSHTSLRHAAILLTSLPTRELNALLGEFNEESQARLRTAVAQLADVPTDEQCRVIEEFLAALESEVQAAGTPTLSECRLCVSYINLCGVYAVILRAPLG